MVDRLICRVAAVPPQCRNVWIRHRWWWLPQAIWYCPGCSRVHSQTISGFRALALTRAGAGRWPS